MKTIYKYKLGIIDEQWIALPFGAKFLSAQFQDGQLYAWALVDPQADDVSTCVRIFGTGQNIGQDLPGFVYLSTVQEGGGLFVWHVFVPESRR